jgi:hypothetical protein
MSVEFEHSQQLIGLGPGGHHQLETIRLHRGQTHLINKFKSSEIA